MQMALEKDFEF